MTVTSVFSDSCSEAFCNKYIRIIKSVLAAGLFAAATPAFCDPPPATEILLNLMSDRARTLASEEYQAPAPSMPAELEKMGYSEYRAINYLSDKALWKGESLFELQFFHPGFLYKEPVEVRIIDKEGVNTRLDFDPALFEYNQPARGLAEVAKPDLGFAGLRVHFPLNSAKYKDEVMVFQGASYFRMVGPGQVYGISARGLAIDTAGANGEEFPAFREFWLLKPSENQGVMHVFALLDSPSVAGAYQFDLRPGAKTSVDIEARLFARKDVNKLGVAPLTSMFHYGENRTRFFDDFRPEVHDSDGLQMLTNSNEWIWRPLTNPTELSIVSLSDENPRGFGLMQRDRDFASYQDTEARYHERPGFWVKPLGDWGKGRVELVEIPSQSETNDNIVAYWVPEQPFRAGDEVRYRYSLTATDGQPGPELLARATSTRIGWAAIPGESKPPPTTERQFIVDFSGETLNELAADLPIRADLSTQSGAYRDLHVTKLPDASGWRVSFKLSPEKSNAVDMRLTLRWGEQQLSEVWNYVWYPNAVK